MPKGTMCELVFVNCEYDTDEDFKKYMKELQDKINSFILDRKVVDIKFISSLPHKLICAIFYEYNTCDDA